jgi:membrane protease YdiL (CAAX protease family)
MAALLAVTPALVQAGGSRVLAYQVAVGLVGIPVMLGVMAWHARRTTGRAGLRAVLRYRARPPFWAYPALLVPMLAWSFAVFFAHGPLREFLARDVFGWLPGHLLPDWTPPRPPDRTWLLAALVLQLLVDGIAAPVAEELYFRGFLLPRLTYLGAWAPLLNTALFTVHHWWQPYNWPQIFLIMLPLVYLVWWRRSVRLSVAMHCAGNSIGAVIGLVGFFAG